MIVALLSLDQTFCDPSMIAVPMIRFKGCVWNVVKNTGLPMVMARRPDINSKHSSSIVRGPATCARHCRVKVVELNHLLANPFPISLIGETGATAGDHQV